MDNNKVYVGDEGQQLVVVWDGTQMRPDSQTKGELLGPYDSHSAVARLRFPNRRRPKDESDDNR